MATEMIGAISGVYDSVRALRETGTPTALEDYLAQLTTPLLTAHPVSYTVLNAIILGEVVKMLHGEGEITDEAHTQIVERTKTVVSDVQGVLPRSEAYFDTLGQVGRQMAEAFAQGKVIYPEELRLTVAEAERGVFRDQLMRANAAVLQRKPRRQ